MKFRKDRRRCTRSGGLECRVLCCDRSGGRKMLLIDCRCREREMKETAAGGCNMLFHEPSVEVKKGTLTGGED